MLVLGAAVSGRAAAILGRSLGYDVAVYDRDSVAIAPLRDTGYQTHSGAWGPRLLERVDLVVTSPGFAEGSGPITAVRDAAVPLISELEFGSSHLGIPYVAVTGTNGKTTVTNLTARMLVASGLRAGAGGNVGTPVCDLVGGKWDLAVLEASSFQLRFIDRFHPRAAAVLNIAADHLDWHGSHEAYRAAKARIFENMTASDTLAFDVDDPGASAVVSAAAADLLPISGTHRPQGGSGPVGDALVVAGESVPLPALDPSYLVDVGVAATLALAVGASRRGVERELAAFHPEPHRRSLVGTWQGVAWVDDSKATNPHAAVAAATAYSSVVLIAGGRNKGLDLGPMTRVPSVRKVIAYGEAAAEIQASARATTEVVPDLGSAVRVAQRVARAGDTVLLAPGCASFDQFSSYAERGEVFTELVEAMMEASA